MAKRRYKALPSRRFFLARLAQKAVMAAGVVIVSLAIGACGYHFAEGQDWLDATLNATMILTSMGPAEPMKTTPGKLFAIFYAIFSGVVFVTLVAVLFAPVLHRFLHRFHIELEPDDESPAEREDE